MTNQTTNQTQTQTNNGKTRWLVGEGRPLDMSGCFSNWSPKVQEGQEVEEEGVGVDVDGNPLRGYAKVRLQDGQEKIAKQRATRLFADAQAILKDLHGSLKAQLDALTGRMGGTRVVPKANYEAFVALRHEAQEKIAKANSHPKVVEANAELRRLGRQTMQVTWYPGLFPPITLADPEDQVRAERLQQSTAEAIGLVVSAVRSGESEQIRSALDNVGSLAQMVGDPALQGNVQRILDIAQGVIRSTKERNLAQAAADRSKSTAVRETNRARMRAAETQLASLQQAAAAVTNELSRFELLDVAEAPSAERQAELAAEAAAVRAETEAHEVRGSLLEADKPILPEEEQVAFAAARVILAEQQSQPDGRFGGLEID